MSKITLIKKVIGDQYVLRSDFRVSQEVDDRIQTSISYIKYEIRNSIKNKMGEKEGKFILVALGWTEGIAHYESYRKT